jgi:hypothetical protein
LRPPHPVILIPAGIELKFAETSQARETSELTVEDASKTKIVEVISPFIHELLLTQPTAFV